MVTPAERTGCEALKVRALHTRALRHTPSLLRALPAQPTAGLSNVMLFAYHLLCSQAASCAEDPPSPPHSAQLVEATDVITARLGDTSAKQ